MRNVTPGSTGNILQEIFNYLKEFIKNPIKEITRLPDWHWPQIMTMQLILSVASGVLSAVISRDFSTWKLAQGIFVFPIVATVIGTVLATFFYYYFQVFEKRTISFQKAVTLVFLANTVFYLFHIVSGFFAFADILGMAFTGMLMIAGLTENFQMDKRRSLRLVGVLFLLIFVVWVLEKMRDTRLSRSVDTGSIDQNL